MSHTCVVCGYPFGKSTFPGGSDMYCSRTCGTRWGDSLLTNPSGLAQCGTSAGYDRHRRKGEPVCASCRAAKTRQVLEARRRRSAALAADPTLAKHGADTTYRSWGCRCAPCTKAHTEYKRARRAK